MALLSVGFQGLSLLPQSEGAHNLLGMVEVEGPMVAAK